MFTRINYKEGKVAITEQASLLAGNKTTACQLSEESQTFSGSRWLLIIIQVSFECSFLSVQYLFINRVAWALTLDN